MARTLNSQEAEDFNEAISGEQQSFASYEAVVENLMNRSEETLELTPELGFWFGDLSLPRSKR
jgi:hypothetical protein